MRIEDVDTAQREYRIADHLDHSDTIIQDVLASPFMIDRKFDLAIQQLINALQLEPHAAGTHYDLAVAYEADKQYDKALDEYERADLENAQDPEKTKSWYQKQHTVLHEKGPHGWWQLQLDGAKQDPHADPYWMAMLNARLGNINEVFALLNQAYKEHNQNMAFILGNDCFDPIHDDPRFKELLHKIGFTNIMPPPKK